MRTLLLLRHAKSSHKDERLADHDRPLTKRGQRDASRMGALLVDDDMVPDLIVNSTSCRTRETTKRVAAAAGYRGPVRYSEELYLADPKHIVAVIAAQPASRSTLLVVGHNPGLEELLLALTKRDESLPTASLVRISLPIRRWRDLKTTTAGKLVKIWRPKEMGEGGEGDILDL